MKVEPRFLTGSGPEIFTGNECLIKGALETEGGTHLLGGYPGSPVAGYFDTLPAIKDLLAEKGIRALINNNEALSAAMLNGTQALPVRAMICMKSVGVHVAADALALGNMVGAHKEGGAIIVYGDDPWSDSTQVAADSRFISRHLYIPVIEPSTPQEIKDFVDLSFKLSRQAELYAGMVLTTNLADGGGTVLCRPNQYPVLNTNRKVELETALINLDKRVLLPPKTWWQEVAFAERFERAIAAARAMGMNRIINPSRSRKPIGFITSGMAHAYLMQALMEMQLEGEYPVLKFGLSYPIDPQLVRELAAQCERIVVVEERRSFIEEQVSSVILQDSQNDLPSGQVEVWGKSFPFDLPGLPDTRGLHPSILIERLAPLLMKVGDEGRPSVAFLQAEIEREMQTIQSASLSEVGNLPARTATFCPGCPHRDTAGLCLEIQRKFMDASYMRANHGRGPMDLIFHGDTGCYTMLMFPPTTSLMHDYSGMGLGGGTGSGVNPFVTNKSVVFMGDSTFFHSGQIAISQAIKLGQDITFIILDNSTTGMTGHQPTPGVEYDIIGNPTAKQDIEEIVSGMTGTSALTVMRVDPEKRREYGRLLEQTFLADGVKVIIADKECGITRTRRKRREERAIARQRGFLPSWQHMNINAEICRFCMACAEMTGCPGLKHASTDYGRKMDTDITTCVDDGACERIHACNSFERVTINRKRPPRSRVPELGLDDIPEPAKRPFAGRWSCCLVGVGGMGIGVATSILVRAGHKEGHNVIFLDKKGLAIRNGGVVSQVVYSADGQNLTAIIPFGKADLLVGVDALEAARTLDGRGRMRIASADRTAAVINTDKVPTIRTLMGLEDYSVEQLEKIIRRYTRTDDYMARDISRICEKYLGSKLYANIMMLGFAFQKGLIPVSMHSMAWAIKDTIHTDFRKNLYAFNMGRKLCLQEDLFRGAAPRTDWRDVLEHRCRWTIRRYSRGQKLADRLRELVADAFARMETLDEELKRALVVRLYDCMRWGGIEYAARYARTVHDVYRKETASGKSGAALHATRAVIHDLAKSMLIKDAVYLAELSSSPEKYARDREKYNVNPANGDRIRYRRLWHGKVRLFGRDVDFDVTVYNWMAAILKRSHWLRKLPNWQKEARGALRMYELKIAEYLAAGPKELSATGAALASSPCLFCSNPRCSQSGCPVESLVPQWTQLAYLGRWQEAAEVLHARNNFPEITSRICPAFCQGQCKQSINGDAVQVRNLEYQIVQKALSEGWIKPRPATAMTGKKVAVIGAGPAGLAAAQQLARSGHKVTVFEKQPLPGGLMQYGIPDFRLEKSLIGRRIEQLTAEGVEFRFGAEVGKDVDAEKLRREHDAVLVTIGAARPRDLKIPGRDNLRVRFGVDFLRDHNSGVDLALQDKVVAVIGGGLTGEDCAEVALLHGAKQVHQFEILPREKTATGTTGLGANADRPAAEAEPADLPGLSRQFCIATKSFNSNGAGLDLEAVKVEWVKGENGPQTPRDIPGTKFRTSVDLVLLAMGFDAVIEKPLAAQLGIELDDKGRPAIANFSMGKGIFAAGDLVTGPSYVITAIDSGRNAAEKINAFLKDRS